MKRKAYRVTAVLALCIVLSGCAQYPHKAVDGAAWDKDWTILGNAVGVETPGNGLTLLDNNTALTTRDTYYATWTVGEPSLYTNEDGDEVDLYEAQLYLLLYGCQSTEDASAEVDTWIERQQQTYFVTDTMTESYNGQDYTLLVYECISPTNPYSRGISAFSVFGTYAISAELTCTDSFPDDVGLMLSDFLSGCHYSADLEGS